MSACNYLFSWFFLILFFSCHLWMFSRSMTPMIPWILKPWESTNIFSLHKMKELSWILSKWVTLNYSKHWIHPTEVYHVQIMNDEIVNFKGRSKTSNPTLGWAKKENSLFFSLVFCTFSHFPQFSSWSCPSKWAPCPLVKVIAMQLSFILLKYNIT